MPATKFRSLIGGYYADGTDKNLPVSIRLNNAGAVNSVSWLKVYPGYSGEMETTPGNRSTIFETPEHGVAVWYALLERYHVAGAITVGDIIKRYGGGQDYSAYISFVVGHSGLSPSHVIILTGDDATLLRFARAMFRYEAGRESPLSDAQILYGFAFARAFAATGKPDVRPLPVGQSASIPTPKPTTGFWGTLASSVFEWLKAPPTSPSVSIPLPGEIPSWLATMREITGTLETPGDSDNPVIMAWCDVIATAFPEMKAYCQSYRHDATPWCGLTIAYVLARHGIRPQFGSTDLERFLWAHSWAKYGTRLDKPKPGAIMIFTRGGGGHVSLFEGEDERGYIIRGGNQSDSVDVMHMPREKLTAIVWPSTLNA